MVFKVKKRINTQRNLKNLNKKEIIASNQTKFGILKVKILQLLDNDRL